GRLHLASGLGQLVGGVAVGDGAGRRTTIDRGGQLTARSLVLAGGDDLALRLDEFLDGLADRRGAWRQAGGSRDGRPESGQGQAGGEDTATHDGIPPLSDDDRRWQGFHHRTRLTGKEKSLPARVVS